MNGTLAFATKLTLLVIFSLFLATIPAQSGELFNSQPLFADVNNANPGPEFIAPYYAVNQSGTSQNFMLRIFRPNLPGQTKQLLYSTPAKTLIKPTCDPGDVELDYETPNEPARHGSFVAWGFKSYTQCNGPSNGWYERRIAQVYITNVSAAKQQTKLLTYQDSELISLNITENHNNAGSVSDLAYLVYNPATHSATLYLYDFQSQQIYSSTNVLIDAP